MLFALVARPPGFGGKVLSFDASEAIKISRSPCRGAVPSGVAIVARALLAAKLGREKVKISGPWSQRKAFKSEMLDDFPKLLPLQGPLRRERDRRRPLAKLRKHHRGIPVLTAPTP